MAEEQKIRIKLKGFDHRILDRSVREIVDAIRRSGAKIAGPILLPTEFKKYTVARSPFVNKKSMEQFEMRIHKRMLYIKNPTAQTIDDLGKLELPAGIDVEIKA